MESLVHGGLNPGKLSKDDEERLEPNRKRNPDNVNDAIREFTKLPLGPHIVHKQFRIDVPLTVGMEITFDRFYPFENLLVHSFSRRRTYEKTEDPAFRVDLERYETFARDNNYKFLAIIDGTIEIEDLKRLQVALAPAKHKKEKTTSVE